jgi:hypothetical protein
MDFVIELSVLDGDATYARVPIVDFIARRTRATGGSRNSTRVTRAQGRRRGD